MKDKHALVILAGILLVSCCALYELSLISHSPFSVVLRQMQQSNSSKEHHVSPPTSLPEADDLSPAPTPCDDADKRRIRAPRPFDQNNVNGCRYPGYHTKYQDDIANTLIAACNILHSINATFVIAQGTVLSILRNQPVFPWPNEDADIYLVLNPQDLDTDFSDNSNISYVPPNVPLFDKSYYFRFGFYNLFGIGDEMDSLFERVQNGTSQYVSNAVDGQQRYKVMYNRADTFNIFRFVKEEATDWTCTGYTVCC